ncbi:MAG TPA: hypothetical protein EYQ00_02925 [Dehalococcoidia bacterium]|nr:hypothetical protein [Dehalococcoidia bacterium]
MSQSYPRPGPTDDGVAGAPKYEEATGVVVHHRGGGDVRKATPSVGDPSENEDLSDAYKQRLSGSAIAIANRLAGAKKQAIHRVPGYGRRRKRESPSLTAPKAAAVSKAQNYEDKRDRDLQESLNAGQSGHALDLILEGAEPQAVVRGGSSYGRR